MKKSVFGLLVLVGFHTQLKAQQQEKDSMALQQLNEVVVSDSRFELKRENSGKTVIKIDAKELAANQGRSVTELINTKSGIEVNGTRSFAGQNQSVFARGGNNRQVLVIIDGIQVSDPSGVNAEYDLRLLNINQIESIEILKGAASTLYGNSAATVVINITTKNPKNEGISFDVASSMGTNQSQDDQNYNLSDFANTVTLQAKHNKLSVLLSGGHQFTNGLSAAIGTEEDAFSRLDGNLKVGYQFSENFEVTASAFYNKLNSDFDNGFPVEDADFSFISEQSRFGLSSKYSYDNGSLHLNTAFNQITRSFQSSFPSAFDSESIVLDVFNKYNFDDSFYTIVGVNIIDNTTLFSEEQNTTTIDPYANVVFVSDFGLNINAGGRLNNHSEYGNNFIYNFNPSYTIKTSGGYVKFLGSYATSFIAPNLSQLFGAFGPNPDLEPEENTTIEGGVEYRPSDRFRISALYFDRKEDNRIVFNSQYENLTETTNFNGVEVELQAQPIEGFSVTANYTYTDGEDGLAFRVPESKINAMIAYDFSEKTYANLAYQYVSDRTDLGDINLESFSLVNFYIKHQLTKQVGFFLTLDNLFNEDYVEVTNFTTRGRNFRFGMNLTF
ncbi:TonB-dependent receptor [uncultured Croceitalea sp.]|uniref:TonB-dependent receptor plug domain-containing protein n=1 Tax=uncultured Croceitalea sp. TaxID=1798908 RepID=UPI003305C9AD